MKIWLTPYPEHPADAPILIEHTRSEGDARRAAAKALGVANLRGLSQVPTDAGVRYYAPGSDDHGGPSVEIEY